MAEPTTQHPVQQSQIGYPLAFRAFRDPCYVCLCLGGWFSVFSTVNPFFYVGLYGSVANGGPSITPYYLAIMCATARSSAIEYLMSRVVMVGLAAVEFGFDVATHCSLWAGYPVALRQPVPG
jgi:hypothetical protein